jgi:hypothetical protein
MAACRSTTGRKTHERQRRDGQEVGGCPSGRHGGGISSSIEDGEPFGADRIRPHPAMPRRAAGLRADRRPPLHRHRRRRSGALTDSTLILEGFGPQPPDTHLRVADHRTICRHQAWTAKSSHWQDGGQCEHAGHFLRTKLTGPMPVPPQDGDAARLWVRQCRRRGLAGASCSAGLCACW